MADSLQDVATALWDRLLVAMRADGMLAHAITSTGFQTTQVLLQLAQDNLLQEKHTPWIPAHIAPAPTAEIFARDFDNPMQQGEVLRFNERTGRWETRLGQVMSKITHYILLPDIGKPLQPYIKPDEPAEPEVV